MKKVFGVFAILITVALLFGAISLSFFRVHGARASATCTPTGFMRDSINLTAALIVTSSSPVTGQINANGCNIGIYFGPGITGTVNNAEVFGANYYGIVNNGSTVNITNSRIHDIGENPLNGDQHGYGIYFTEDNVSKGAISNSLIWNYQKNGIVVRGVGSNAKISKNTVIGQGPVNYIAQNGIEVGAGAKATVNSNIVIGNSYSGTNNASSGGILIYGGSCYGGSLTIGTKVTNNTVVGNDVGVYLSNLDGTNCVPTLTPTNITVNHNIITNDGVNNISGNGDGTGYQAGISDQGDNDLMTNNSICGTGYSPVTPPPHLFMIDITVTNSPTVSGNTSCLDGSPVTSSAASDSRSHATNHNGAKI
jgi:hypothetical protein